MDCLYFWHYSFSASVLKMQVLLGAEREIRNTKVIYMKWFYMILLVYSTTLRVYFFELFLMTLLFSSPLLLLYPRGGNNFLILFWSRFCSNKNRLRNVSKRTRLALPQHSYILQQMDFSRVRTDSNIYNTRIYITCVKLRVSKESTSRAAFMYQDLAKRTAGTFWVLMLLWWKLGCRDIRTVCADETGLLTSAFRAARPQIWFSKGRTG